jgi:hypothetical protein
LWTGTYVTGGGRDTTGGGGEMTGGARDITGGGGDTTDRKCDSLTNQYHNIQQKDNKNYTNLLETRKIFF